MSEYASPWELELPKAEPPFAYIPDGDPDQAFEALHIFDANGNNIAIIPIDVYLGTQVDANAHLMVAAPDLLEACKDALEDGEAFPLSRTIKRKLKAAIAKAKGTSL